MAHLIHAIIQSYTLWYHHTKMSGEAQSNFEFEDNNDIEDGDDEDEIHHLLRDMYPNLGEIL